MKSRVFISTIKATFKLSVAGDKTPGAPMLEVIALVMFAFSAKRSHRKAKRSQYVHTILTASSFSGL